MTTSNAFLLLACLAAAPGQAAKYSVLHTFPAAPEGSVPYAGLVQDPAGNFYGTASGSTNGPGVVFELSNTGTYTVLHTFKTGDLPFGGVIRDTGGNLYGTTFLGGASNLGVVFKLTRSGQYSILHHFSGKDGSEPYGTLLLDAAGNLYGSTVLGGKSNYGVVFKLDPSGTETVLHSFNGGADGAEPYAGLIEDAEGNLYGATAYGGDALSYGVIFKLDSTGKETVLYTFNGYDGAYPRGNLLMDSAGNLYGTTEEGGTGGCGIVFKLDPQGALTTLHNFTGGATTPFDGAYPYAGVIMDAARNLYGATSSGAYPGTVFMLDPAGDETILYTFTCDYYQNDPSSLNACVPMGPLIQDAAGNLYGTTIDGGIDQLGTIFELSTSGTESLLFSFPAMTSGAQPAAGLVRDSAGNLYGTTLGGGAYPCNGALGPGPPGCGTVFEMSAGGQETVLYSFTQEANPKGDLLLDSTGNLYGTASTGGTSGAGAVFKLDAGNESVLYSFTGGADGGKPLGGLVEDSAGNLYGVASTGGASNQGVVYELDASGNQTVLHAFTGGLDGGAPLAGLIEDSSGNLYGTASTGGVSNAGVVFKMTTQGTETVLHSFAGPDGSGPAARLLMDSAGNLYGTTASGGASNAGAVFEINAAGNETVLYSFTGRADGKSPEAGLVEDSAGNLYGTTNLGGIEPYSTSSGYGVVFKVGPSGTETVLYSFKGTTDGANPVSDLIMDQEGNLYGTAQYGGESSYVLGTFGAAGGVIFKVVP